MAEDARVLTIRRKEQERIANEKQAMLDKQRKAEAEASASAAAEAQAKAQAEEDARRRAQAEADTAAAERAQAAAQAQQAQADAARAAALADQQKAEAAAAEAIRQKEEQRQRLLNQLNQVLETRDTPRGLVVSMPDVLFDTGSYTLKPAARERLARVSGIVLAYPDLRLEIEGHTDSVGSDELQPGLVGEAGRFSAGLSSGQRGVDQQRNRARIGKGKPGGRQQHRCRPETESPRGDDRVRRRDRDPDHAGRNDVSAAIATIGTRERARVYSFRKCHPERSGCFAMRSSRALERSLEAARTRMKGENFRSRTEWNQGEPRKMEGHEFTRATNVSAGPA